MKGALWRMAAPSALLAVSLFGATACGSVSTKPLTASEIVNKSNTSSLKDATFDLSINVSGGQAGSFTGTGNGKMTKNPDRLYLKFSATVLGTQVTFEQISAGGYDYAKNSFDSNGDKWTKTAASSDTTGDFSAIGDLQNATLVGKEKINGVDTYHLSGTPKATSTPTAGTTESSTEDLWVRTDNFYPVKAVEHQTTTDSTGTSTTDGTITFTAWNSGATIDVPSDSDVVSG